MTNWMEWSHIWAAHFANHRWGKWKDKRNCSQLPSTVNSGPFLMELISIAHPQHSYPQHINNASSVKDLTAVTAFIMPNFRHWVTIQFTPSQNHLAITILNQQIQLVINNFCEYNREGIFLFSIRKQTTPYFAMVFNFWLSIFTFFDMVIASLIRCESLQQDVTNMS